MKHVTLSMHVVGPVTVTLLIMYRALLVVTQVFVCSRVSCVRVTRTGSYAGVQAGRVGQRRSGEECPGKWNWKGTDHYLFVFTYSI